MLRILLRSGTVAIMKFNSHLFLLVIWMLVGLASANAQSAQRDAAAIRYARGYLVSKIDKYTPRVRFDTWLRKVAGKKAKTTWEVNDCGEQTGTRADRGRDFPMCVEANTKSGDVEFLVSLMVGTFKKGISGKIQLGHIEFHVEGEERNELNTLSDLADAMKKLIG